MALCRVERHSPPGGGAAAGSGAGGLCCTFCVKHVCSDVQLVHFQQCVSLCTQLNCDCLTLVHKPGNWLLYPFLCEYEGCALSQDSKDLICEPVRPLPLACGLSKK